jgi:hypothetical protein
VVKKRGSLTWRSWPEIARSHGVQAPAKLEIPKDISPEELELAIFYSTSTSSAKPFRTFTLSFKSHWNASQNVSMHITSLDPLTGLAATWGWRHNPEPTTVAGLATAQ